MRGMCQDWRSLGPPPDMPDLQSDALLRRFAEQARHKTCAGERTSCHRVGPTGRAVALLLSGRRFSRILIFAGSIGGTKRLLQTCLRIVTVPAVSLAISNPKRS